MAGRIIGTLAVALVAGLAGCGGGVFTQPEVSLSNVELAGLGLRGGTLLVDVQITNPNRFSLSANSLDYELSIADADDEVPGDTIWYDFASGRYDEDFTVGAGATESVQIPVEFSYSGLGGAASSLLRAGTFNYRATGMVDVRTPLGSREVPFRRRGMISLLGAS